MKITDTYKYVISNMLSMSELHCHTYSVQSINTFGNTKVNILHKSHEQNYMMHQYSWLNRLHKILHRYLRLDKHYLVKPLGRKHSLIVGVTAKHHYLETGSSGPVKNRHLNLHNQGRNTGQQHL